MSQAGTFLRGGGAGIPIETITGNTGGPVGPDGANNINLLGTAGQLDVAGNPGTNTLVISLDGSVALSFVTDAGTATPVAGVLDVLGAHGINTAGATNVVTVAIDNAIVLGDLAVLGAGVDALTLTTGDESILAGNLNLPTTASADVGVIEVNSTRFIHSYGSSNTFVGSGSGNFTLTVLNAQLNTAFGALTLSSLTDGAANCAAGYFSLNACTTGTGNTALGFEVLPQITTGSNNTGCGADCLNSLTAGASLNTCYGGGTLSGLISGSHNIAVGYGTGQPYNGAESNNILIGPSTLGVVGENNTLRIGETGVGAGQQSNCYIAGITGVNVGSVASVVSISGDHLGTTTITAGVGITVTPGANTITISGSGTTNLAYTNVNTSPYVVLTTDEYLSVDCSGGPITLQFPNAATLGRAFIVKDRTGSANTNNITVTTVGGAVNIDGATSYVMNTQYAAIDLIGNGTTYEIF